MAIHLLDDQHWQGLHLFAVRRRLEQFGANALTPPKGPGALRRLLQQFVDPLVIILVAAGVVAMLLMDALGWLLRRLRID